MTFARASDLDRLLLCAGSAVLPHTVIKSDRAREAADWGTMVHHWVESGEIIGSDSHVRTFNKKLVSLGDNFHRNHFWPGLTHEVAVALQPLGNVEAMVDGTREEKEEWKAAHDDSWITGTADGYGFIFDDLWVDDLKTGRLVDFEDYRYQIQFYGLAISRWLKHDGDVKLTISHWPRYPLHCLPVRFGTTLTQAELLTFEKQLARLRDSITVGRTNNSLVQFNPGESQCRFCPSALGCPAIYRGDTNE